MEAKARRKLRTLLAGHPSDVRSHGSRLLALQQPGRHPALACAADADGVRDAVSRDRTDLVEVGPGHPAGVHGVEVVAARAGLLEALLTPLLLGRQLPLLEPVRAARRLAATRDHGSGDRDAHPQVEQG